MTKNVADNEVDNHEGECANNKTNTGVKDSFFSFFGFAGVARRSHILDTADNNVDNGNESGYADDGAEDASDGGLQAVGIAIAASSFFDRFWYIRTANVGVCGESWHGEDCGKPKDAKSNGDNGFKIFFHSVSPLK